MNDFVHLENVKITDVEVYKSFTKLKEVIDTYFDCPDLEEDEHGWQTYDRADQDEVEEAIIEFVKDWDYEKNVADYVDKMDKINAEEQEKKMSEINRKELENHALGEIIRSKYPELLNGLLKEYTDLND